MIFNATLLRVDPPPPAPQGPAMLVRCALTTPTVVQAQEIQAMNWSSSETLVAYLPLHALPAPWPEGEGRVQVQTDGGAATTFRIIRVVHREAATLGHLQLYLEPV